MAAEGDIAVPEGAIVYDFTPDMMELLMQSEMQALRDLLSVQGAKVLLAQLGAMTPDELRELRRRIPQTEPVGPAG